MTGSTSTGPRPDARRLAFELGRAFAQFLDLDGLLAFAVAKCREVLDAAGVAVLFVDREANQLYFPYVAEEDPVVAARVRRARFPTDRGIAGAVLASGRSLRIDDAATDSRFYRGVDQMTGLATHAIICAPLLASDGPVGLIEAVNPVGRNVFNDDDLALLDVVAQSLAELVDEHRQPQAPVEPLSRARQAGGAQERPRDKKADCRAVLRFEGEYWTVEYDGKARRLKDAAGLHYIARLLEHPDRELHVLDLVHAYGHGHTGRTPVEEADGRVSSEGLTVLDARAKAQYRSRLRELDEELEEAERLNDLGRADQVRREKDFLSQQLAAALGLGQKDRVVGADAERARSAVTKRIRLTIRRIEEANPALARHFFRQIHTGQYCKYVQDSDHPVVWRL